MFNFDENAAKWLMRNAGVPSISITKDYIVEVLTSYGGYSGSPMSAVRLSDVIHSAIATSKLGTIDVGRILISPKKCEGLINKYHLLDGPRIKNG
jgi:hypothetical protein